MSKTKKTEPEKTKVQNGKNEAGQSPDDQAQKGATPQDDTSISNGSDKSQETTLSEAVTPEPQDPEHMHLDILGDSPDLLKAYLAVSDDEGQLLGDVNLEKEVIDICNQYKTVDYKKIDNPEQRLKEVMILTTKYGTRVNMVENILGGAICKYRIREGGLFYIQKAITDEIGWVWKKWFKKNYNPTHFRSVSDYMKLAAVPGIIRYAVFGKTRLLLMLRLIEDFEGEEDPIGAFLQENGIDFDIQAETDPKELRVQTDITINWKKLEAAELDVIPVDMVEVLVRNGKELLPKHISSLKFLKEHDGDVIGHMEEIIATDGNPEPIMTPKKKAESFKNVIDRFLKAAETAFADSEYLSQIDADFFIKFKQQVLALEKRVITSD